MSSNLWTWDFEKTKECEIHPCENTVVARSSMGTAFYLFSHQVGGHKPFLRKDVGEVCKPKIAREADFYTSSILKWPNLKAFVPNYVGSIDVDLRHFQENECDDETKTSSNMIHASSSSSREDIDEVRNKRRRVSNASPRPAEFSYRLWKKLSDKQCSTTGTNWLCEYIVLEDLTQGMLRPCVLDIKMGTQQHGKFASASKVKSHTLKCQRTTSFEMGLRLCGMQVLLIIFVEEW